MTATDGYDDPGEPGEPLRAVTDTDRQCPAKRIEWPAQQCELLGGHDGQHQAHGLTRREIVVWTTGRRG